MRQNLPKTLWLFLAMVLFCPSVDAEETLNSFQQEVVTAKQKQQIISGKAQTLNATMQEDEPSDLEEEADRLMQELVEKKYTRVSGSSQETTKPADEEKSKGQNGGWLSNIKNFVSGKSPEFRNENKSIRLTPTPEPPKSPTPKAKPSDKGWFFFGGGEEKIPEGEVLYKVAVSDNKVTLKEAVDIGIANNISLQASKKKIEVADAKLTEAKRALFPTIQAVMEFNGGKVGGQVLDTDGSDTLTDGQRIYLGENRKINLNQPLFYGGELVMTVRQAEENLKSARAEYEKTKNELIHNIRTAYYGVVKAEYNVQYQAELFQKVNTIYQRVKEEHAAKVISEVDYLNVESLYHQTYFQVESGKNDLLSASTILHHALSMQGDEPLPINLRLSFHPIDVQLKEVLDKALLSNPEVIIKEHAYISAQYGLKIFKAKRYPRVDLRGSYGMLGEIFKDTRAIRDDNHDLDTEKEWFLGLHASMPLGPNTVEFDRIKHKYGPTVLSLTGSEDWRQKIAFNLFDNLSNITDEKSAQATLLQAQSDYEKAKNDLVIKVRDDFYNLHKSVIQIDSAISKVRYQEKQNGILEYLLGLQETAVATYIEGLVEQSQNRFSFIQAVTDYQLAVSGLGNSLGDPYYFEDQS